VRPPRPDAELRRRLTMLLDQQLWCLGADIRYRGGNLLVARGFARHRPTGGRSGGSAYHGRLGAVELVLWGFGVWATGPAEGALFLGRRAPLPLRWRGDVEAPVAVHGPQAFRAWRPADTPLATRASRALMVATCQAFAHHERDIAETCGTAHRAMPRPMASQRSIRPDGMAAAWAAMAARFLDTPDTPCSTPSA
jgi:hypothetical protein